ncbi:MAG: hypothetical protein SPG34_05795 [Trueperella sp.]|uniref:hypothetical protein n=1 Tax=Trueperella sp. TaxID=2699835 RepID=UPI002A91A435|nr:hypothetical protein [Trueperella sp.]MDY5403832.1 hypothetical protein [Trueperella sp.]
MSVMDEFPEVEGVDVPLLYVSPADCAMVEIEAPMIRWLVSHGIQPPNNDPGLKWWAKYVNGDMIAVLYRHVAFNPTRWYFLPPEGKTIEDLIPEYWVGVGECPQ